MQFLRDQSDHYGIDGGRIGAIGLSAGGHLAALLGTSAGVKELKRRVPLNRRVVQCKLSLLWERRPICFPFA